MSDLREARKITLLCCFAFHQGITMRKTVQRVSSHLGDESVKRYSCKP